MAKKDYKIRAKFVFDGHAVVRAAEKYLAAHLGKVEPLDECITDWNFSMKSNTVVNRKREEAEL